ncbi:hypothetical protein HMPREF9123_2847 [Neisseria bacilliformis ATCC BAA-1200]|uniref:Uncharacterized protein n=1 Tax=Neisseria bacilliformis ATCC BAA-1200 TaxID=888742 RepID=F2BGJ0_9NEIS|nr:hypothetical protein HMPREF9123_2847 [Neisseria bacilliformis ATCC BAA-1200]
MGIGRLKTGKSVFRRPFRYKSSLNRRFRHTAAQQASKSQRFRLHCFTMRPFFTNT